MPRRTDCTPRPRDERWRARFHTSHDSHGVVGEPGLPSRKLLQPRTLEVASHTPPRRSVNAATSPPFGFVRYTPQFGVAPPQVLRIARLAVRRTMAIGEAPAPRRLSGPERERLVALVARLRAAESAPAPLVEAVEALEVLAGGQQGRVRPRRVRRREQACLAARRAQAARRRRAGSVAPVVRRTNLGRMARTALACWR